MNIARLALVSTLLVACTPSAAPPATPADEAPTAGADQETFWVELAALYNAKIDQCKTGWTGDGSLVAKDGKIVKFVIDEGGSEPTVVAALEGVALPAIPASLKATFEAPVAVSVCTGRARAAN